MLTIEILKDGFLHCEEGPALIFDTGTKIWFFGGKRHRLDGPACEYVNGFKEWYIDGEQQYEH